MLADDKVFKLLQENFLVAIDSGSTRNCVSFGVNIWFFTPEGKEIKSYFYGTGNDTIGMVDGNYMMRRHNRQVKEMLTQIEDAIKKFTEMKDEQKKE